MPETQLFRPGLARNLSVRPSGSFRPSCQKPSKIRPGRARGPAAPALKERADTPPARPATRVPAARGAARGGGRRCVVFFVSPKRPIAAPRGPNQPMVGMGGPRFAARAATLVLGLGGPNGRLLTWSGVGGMPIFFEKKGQQFTYTPDCGPVRPGSAHGRYGRSAFRGAPYKTLSGLGRSNGRLFYGRARDI
jgi:hypothetical protein